MLLSWGSSLGNFLGQYKRGKKKRKIIRSYRYTGFSQELKDGILYCISIFLRGNKIILRSI